MGVHIKLLENWIAINLWYFKHPIKRLHFPFSPTHFSICMWGTQLGVWVCVCVGSYRLKRLRLGLCGVFRIKENELIRHIIVW
jgi:hypothetical protein